jgi:hypothetical protein
MSGRITRRELAQVITEAIDSPFSAGKTFEVRRDQTESGKLSDKNGENNWGHRYGSGTAQNFNSLFRGLVLDEDRVVGGGGAALLSPCLPPFPCARPPPSEPLPEQRVQEILNDPR